MMTNVLAFQEKERKKMKVQLRKFASCWQHLNALPDTWITFGFIIFLLTLAVSDYTSHFDRFKFFSVVARFIVLAEGEI